MLFGGRLLRFSSGIPALLAAGLIGLGVGCDRDETIETTDATPVDTDVAVAQPAAGTVEPTAAIVAVKEEGDMLRQTTLWPTGEADSSVLRIERVSPKQVVVGKPLDYQIQVTNLSNAMLSGVIVKEQLPGTFAIDQSQPQAQHMQQTQHMQHSQQPQQSQQASQQQNQQQAQSQQQNQQQAQSQQQQSQQAQWQLNELKPGETKNIQVRGFAEQQGELTSCITVQYNPTLCARPVQVINPQLALTKSGPDRVDICEQIVWKYTVRNEGSGTAEGIVITDELPEGLKTEDGKNSVSLQVGDLQAGQSKDASITLIADRTGDFGSRAMAKSENDEAHSKRVETSVIQPELALTIDAPDMEYVNRQFQYEVTIKNNGEAAAENVSLQLSDPKNAEFVRGPRLDNQQDAQLAAAREGDEEAGAMNVGTIEPGNSRTLRLVYVGTEGGEATLEAIAQAQCERAGDAARAKDQAQVMIETIPALQLVVVDQQDPVRNGENTFYSVSVINEGSGEDTNIQVKGELPETLKFVRGDGPTELKAEGNTITFGSLKALKPGTNAQWLIEVQGVKAGQDQFRVELNSDALNRPARGQEPTRVY